MTIIAFVRERYLSTDIFDLGHHDQPWALANRNVEFDTSKDNTVPITGLCQYAVQVTLCSSNLLSNQVCTRFLESSFQIIIG